jgi:CelD/BcsL family acetyltransferase involved in cellulose biosynthesis
LLYLDEKPVAYDLGVVTNGCFYYLKTSYDQEYRSLSPSTVLRSRVIESAIRAGLSYFDFPAEPYSWERQWADEARWHKSLLVFSRRVRARTAATLLAVRERRKSIPSERIIDYADARARPG